MNEEQFQQEFKRLTGHGPLRWQWRLFSQWFAKNELPDVIDLPTGLGKTMVMAIWLIARQVNSELPRRLIYVVDRRTVVDQATETATKIRQAVGENELAVSTLRGQLADNHEWYRDPSLPAIIIGTVDLIGSALLFSGYRSSYKRRPLEAGLLGQDSLLVLDEAHLSKPFEKLLGAIEQFNKRRAVEHSRTKPMRVIRMSATSGNLTAPKRPFTLQLDSAGNLTGDDASDETTAERFNAKKRLTITRLTEKQKLVDMLAQAAIELVAPSVPNRKPVVGQRIVVFTRKPEDARAIGEAIRKHSVEMIDGSGNKPKKVAIYNQSVEVLTGTMRGLERDSFVERPVVKRFLNGDEDPLDPASQVPIFLVSTSAGEIGFDLNGDHMVCDATTIDSLIQRLGRVNRRGKCDAQVHMLIERSSMDANGDQKKGDDLGQAIARTLDLLTDGMAVSPESVAHLRHTAWSASPQGIDNSESLYDVACAPEPGTVELTDILLDAWSMTSITDRVPGRPDVGPWLRGTDDGHAQTAVAWRAELELLRQNEAPEKALEAVFAKHPIRPHESLTVNTRQLIETFLKKIPKLRDRPSNVVSTRVAIRLSGGKVICKTIENLLGDPGILYADSTLVLPATFGGLDSESGMLHADSIPSTRKTGDPPSKSLDVADCEGYEQTDTVRPRLRILITKSDNGSWVPDAVAGGGPIPDDVNRQLEPEYEKTTPLFTALKRANLRVRLVQPVAFNDEGETVQLLVSLGPAPKIRKVEDQSLSDHVAEVKQHAERIADELAVHNAFRKALLFAARWHDEGKKADIWQTFANGPMPDGAHKGKTAMARNPRTLKKYRHELGHGNRILSRCENDLFEGGRIPGSPLSLSTNTSL